ncbi:MAG: STAS domain-containing protein [Fibrobacterota bacterium]
MSLEKNLKKGYAALKITDSVFIHRQASEFKKAFSEFRAQGISNFAVDLTECSYISSEGLAAVAEMWNWCHEKENGRFALALSTEPGNEIRYLFDIIGLSVAMNGYIFSSAGEAESSVSG